MTDYSGTEYDAGIAAGFDACKADDECDWWHDEYPYDWPAEASDRIIAALHADMEMNAR